MVPGASIAVHTYGDFFNVNPHVHAIVSDGVFDADGGFLASPAFHGVNLEEAFRL